MIEDEKNKVKDDKKIKTKINIFNKLQYLKIKIIIFFIIDIFYFGYSLYTI